MEWGTPKAGNCYKQVLVRMFHWEYFPQAVARGTSELTATAVALSYCYQLLDVTRS